MGAQETHVPLGLFANSTVGSEKTRGRKWRGWRLSTYLMTSKFAESVNLPMWNGGALREGSHKKSESPSHGQVICGKWPLRSSGLMWNWPFHFFPLMLNIPEANMLEMKRKHPPLAREPWLQTACTWYMAGDSKVAGGKISSQVDQLSPGNSTASFRTQTTRETCSLEFNSVL